MTSATGPGAPPQFHVLAKPTGAICNLDCPYCFYLSKESLYPGDGFRMADGVLEAYIGQLLAAHRTSEVTIAWQGGEPMLMGVDFLRRGVEIAERLKQPGVTLSHTIQTNATLITGEWARFFVEHNFLVGVSIDGPRELHDAYRVDNKAKPTFDTATSTPATTSWSPGISSATSCRRSWWSSLPSPSNGRSATPSATHSRSSVASARPCSRATASVRRTGSSSPTTASPG